jgi:flagellar basal body-associated protein FliL
MDIKILAIGIILTFVAIFAISKYFTKKNSTKNDEDENPQDIYPLW